MLKFVAVCSYSAEVDSSEERLLDFDQVVLSDSLFLSEPFGLAISMPEKNWTVWNFEGQQ